MEIPNELRLAIDKVTEGIKFSRMYEDAQNVSLRYRSESGSGKRLLTDINEAAAYSAVRMPATYGAVLSALNFTLESADICLETLLDAGSGTGAAAWAADSLLDLKSITCLEREEAMLSTGMRLMSEVPELLNKTSWLKQDLVKDDITLKADMVTAAYALNEMTKDSRIRVLDKLWDAADKLLLLVEPGTPAGYSELKAARDYLLKKGAHILAPCPHEKECRMTEEDWCHFTCRVPRSRLHRQLKGGDVPYEDEKFAYLAVSRLSMGHAEARILRHPYTDKGRISLDLCREEGIRKTDVYKKDGEAYKLARKAKCGDAFRMK